MKIAIPHDNGRLHGHFGGCREFALVEVDPQTKVPLRTEIVPAPEHQPGLFPRWLREQGDLIYMNRVFHHFAKPEPMLQRLWQDLKPGGLLVIVDQQKGPLTDWAPMESRQDQHHWTGETTVVRLAREAGLLTIGFRIQSGGQLARCVQQVFRTLRTSRSLCTRAGAALITRE